jgi:P-type Cu2+ transporter
MSTSTVEISGGVISPRRAGKGKPTASAGCRHCGSALIDDRMVQTGFCCAGCSYVFRLVHEHGLAGYYNIKDDITVPADTAVFQPRDYQWLDEAQRVADSAAGGIPELMVDVQGISCTGCVWLIERVFQQQPGARDVFVNAQYGSMRMRWVRGDFSAANFARTLQSFGYLIGPAGEIVAEPESRGLVKRIGLCAAFTMNVMLFSLPTYFGMERSFEWARLFGLLSLMFGTLSFLVGGAYFVGRAIQALRGRVMHIDLPIALGIAGAYIGSLYGWMAGEDRFVYFDFVSTFILLMLVGRWAQTAAVERNRRRLLSQQPKPQRVRLATGEQVMPEQLRSGHAIIISTGQIVPVESRLEAEQAQFSLASINGEAEPRIFQQGQKVPAGSVNVGRAAVQLTAQQEWADSLLAQLLEVGDRRAEPHRWLEMIVRGYVIGIIAVAILSGAAWWYFTGSALRAGAVVTAVLVVSCPCAIGLAFPLAEEMAVVSLRRRGVFVREADLWTKLHRVRKLVFDKTGTLTLETPVWLNPEVLSELDSTARSALLALVRDNCHPVSECLREQLLADGPGEALAGSVTEVVGAGVELGSWSLGKRGWRAAGGPNFLPRDFDGSDTVLAFEDRVVASFRFSDRPRPDAVAEIAAVRSRGLAVFVLSGDHIEKVQRLAAELGLPRQNAVGDASPEAKARWLDAIGAGDALMLGDGANDSLAFDRALCRGTPVIHRGVLERKADFYYLGRGISGIRALFEIDQIRRRTQMAILVFSVGYNALAVGLAVAGLMNPLVAAALMPANSLLTLAIVTAGMRPAFRR